MNWKGARAFLSLVFARRGAGRKHSYPSRCVWRDTRRAHMLYDAVCGDSMDIIFRELCNPLDPGFGIAGISSTSKLANFRDLLSPQTLRWLRSRHVAAEALAHKARMSRDQLRLALTAEWTKAAAVNEDDMQMLGTLSSLLLVLRHCRVVCSGPACCSWRRNCAQMRSQVSFAFAYRLPLVHRRWATQAPSRSPPPCAKVPCLSSRSCVSDCHIEPRSTVNRLVD